MPNKESKNDVLKYFSSTVSTFSQAIKKRKLSSHDANVVQNNEISLSSTSSQIPAFDLLDNTKKIVTNYF